METYDSEGLVERRSERRMGCRFGPMRCIVIVPVWTSVALCAIAVARERTELDDRITRIVEQADLERGWNVAREARAARTHKSLC